MITSKEKKKVLLKYGEAENRIEQLRLEKESRWVRATFKGPNMQGMPGGGKPDGTQTERATEIADKFDKLIIHELEKQYALRVRIEQAINSLLDINEQRLLRLVYIGEIINGKTKRVKLYEAAKIMNYSERQIDRIHGLALKHLPDIK